MSDAVVMIDVSQYQGVINWLTAATQAQVVYMRATMSRAGIDTQFSCNWPAAYAAGLVRGAYHVFVPRQTPADDPIKQAAHF